MWKRPSPYLPALCVLASLAAALPLLGSAAVDAPDTRMDSPQRVEQRRVDLSGAPNMEVIASTAEYPPGTGIALHLHHGVEVAYVVQGATIQIDGKPPITLATGQSLMNLRDVPHGNFTIVGATALKLFTVHIVDKGAPLYDPAPQSRQTAQ